jgi:phage gp45-like
MSIDFLKSCLDKMNKAMKGIVKRAYISNVATDDKHYHIVQISYLSPKKTANSELINPYGLYTNPPNGLQALTFSVQAHEENKICMAYSQADRFKNLKEGETLIGNTKTQSFIKFDSDGNIIIDSKAKVIINSAKDITVECKGKININSSQEIDISTEQDVNVKANNVKVDASKVDLGVGGQNIARLGDAVEVDPDTGIGSITGGGINTSI